MPARLSTLVNCHPSTRAAKGPEVEKGRLIEVEIMADRELAAAMVERAMAVVKVRVMAPARAVAQAAAVVKVRVTAPARAVAQAAAVAKVRVTAPARAVAQAAAVVKVRVTVQETTAAGQLLH
jgi:uncharacterized UPF0146 family protein